MIRKLKKSQLMKRISIVILIVFSISFLVPTYSHAGFWDWLGDTVGETVGGVLAKPVLFFSRLLGDAVINLLQGQFIDGAGKAVSNDNSQEVLSALEELKQYYLDNSDSFLSEEDKEKLKNGTEEEKEEVEDKIIEKVETKTEVSAYTGQRMYNPGDGTKDASLYGNNIKPIKSGDKYYVSLSQIELLEAGNAENYANNYLSGFYGRGGKLNIPEFTGALDNRDYGGDDRFAYQAAANALIAAYKKDKTKFYAYDIDGNTYRADEKDKIEEALNNETELQDEEQRLIDNVVKAREELLNGDSDLYLNIQYSPARIFGNKIPFLDANFITTPQDGSIAQDIQGTIATWYVALRNLALVILLSVLVYVGIRIVISSSAGETSKYKTMLKDWLVAMCLLFFLHYMMAFFIEASQRVTDFLSTGTDEVFEGDNRDEFMEYVREEAEDTSTNKKLPNIEPDGDLVEAFGFTLMYLLLVFYTLMFTWKYLKRLIYLAFLTVIAPMVAMTYPIDKIRDGSAQAYNMWFKEYLFNILLQPLHLVLYTVLVGVARGFTESDAGTVDYKFVIYAIVALAFMLEAEQIIKSFFGFDKAKGGGLGAAITGGAMFGAAAGLLNRGGKSKSSNNVLSNKSSSDSDTGEGNKLGDGISLREAFGQDNSRETPESHELPESTEQTGNNQIPLNDMPSNVQSEYIAAGYGDEDYSMSQAYRMRQENNADSEVANDNNQADTISTAGASDSNHVDTHVNSSPKPNRIAGIRKVVGRYTSSGNMRNLARKVAKAYGAATLGTVGLAAGLASNNDGDILKYAGVGMAAGSSLGGKLSDSSFNAVNNTRNAVSNAIDDYQIGAYGKIDPDRANEKWGKDDGIQKYYKDKYGAKWKEAMERAKKFRKNGLSSQKDLDRAEKLYSNNSGNLNVDQASAIVNFSNDVKNLDVVKSRDKIDKLLQEQGINNVNDRNNLIGYLEQDRSARPYGSLPGSNNH